MLPEVSRCNGLCTSWRCRADGDVDIADTDDDVSVRKVAAERCST